MAHDTPIVSEMVEVGEFVRNAANQMHRIATPTKWRCTLDNIYM
jgi:hypothetical protein